ncbi:hypothetical protein ACPPVU_22440 [Mucilaginibacter sp. McL0603]|uniref:hypothetical protein n=1 Tax=Mucilaginibacter sp. McL0603 TaxID=3415670 RepID=UPI003CF447C4
MFFVKDELTVQSYNLYSNAIGGVKLQVLQEDVERARDILTELGYIKDEPIKSDLLTQIDQKKSSIPFFKSISAANGIILLTVIFVITITTLLYFIFRPSLYDILTSNSWCVDKIYYKSTLIGPKTTGIFIKMTTDRNGEADCDEQMSFDKNHRITLPGVNSNSVVGQWQEGDDIIITVNSFENIFAGTYKVDISNNLVTLKSKTTVIYAHRDDYRMPMSF